MTSGTCGRLCKIQGSVFKPTYSTPSRLQLLFGGLNKLAGAPFLLPEPANVEALRVPINGSGTLVPISAVFHAPTPALTKAPVPGQALTYSLDPLNKYTSEELQSATKLALELFV